MYRVDKKQRAQNAMLQSCRQHAVCVRNTHMRAVLLLQVVFFGVSVIYYGRLEYLGPTIQTKKTMLSSWYSQ